MHTTSGDGRPRRQLRVIVAAGLVAPMAFALAAPPAGAVVEGSLSAAISPSWQANATVWRMAYGNGHIWMVGDFTKLRPPGAAAGKHQQVARNFAALTASTGAFDPAIDHTHRFTGQPSGQLPLTNGTVAVSPDGSTVYVGGTFTKVDGQPRDHIAAFSSSTGALLPWSAEVNGRVDAIAIHGADVYIGGGFGKVGTAHRSNLAVVSASTGSVLSWGSGAQPSTNATVDALAVSPDGTQVLAGGYFNKVDGLTKSGDGRTRFNKAVRLAGMAAADPGTLEAMPADSVVPKGTDTDNTGCTSDVKDIVISDGVGYLANEGTGRGCFDGTWAVELSNGALRWVNRCLGATQTLAVVNDYLYKGSHAHDCRTTNHNGDPANFPQVPGDAARHLLSEHLSDGYLGPWYPTSNSGPDLGPRAMATDGHQLYVGGDFTTVDQVGQQAIARFTTTTNYPTPTPAAPIVRSARGVVTVRATPPVDLDDPHLRMELFRAGTTNPIATTVVRSLFWSHPRVRWRDTHTRLGARYSYTVRAVPVSGSAASPSSRSRSVTVACATSRAVPAALALVRVADRGGHRRLRIRTCATQPVRMKVQARRDGRVLSSRVLREVPAGNHHAYLRIGDRVAHGPIQARVVFSRSAHRKVARRTVQLPKP
ncbi:MAG TPA: hypothetical protein VMH41_13015 [Mycobacteriales bacterium]|nr:hypothetical protein [Mycobacteriales bacterium]